MKISTVITLFVVFLASTSLCAAENQGAPSDVQRSQTSQKALLLPAVQKVREQEAEQEANSTVDSVKPQDPKINGGLNRDIIRRKAVYPE